jgi:hypothetical protein
VLVELWDHGDPLDRHRNDALATLAEKPAHTTAHLGELPAFRFREPSRTERAESDERLEVMPLRGDGGSRGE